jgi:hypothetical protein
MYFDESECQCERQRSSKPDNVQCTCGGCMLTFCLCHSESVFNQQKELTGAGARGPAGKEVPRPAASLATLQVSVCNVS